MAGIAFLLVVVSAVSGTPEQANAAGPDPDPAPAAPTPEPAPPEPPKEYPNTSDVEAFVARVQPGDTLTAIFRRHGVPARDLRLLVESGPLGKRLETIYPGYEFEFGRDAQDNLVHLKYRPGRWETVEFQRVGDRFEGSAFVEEPDEVVAYRHARIERSLFSACQNIDLDDEFATRLASIFQWDIDFILDIRKDDEFHVLYHEHRLGDQVVDFGDILAVEFINQGVAYKAVRYEDETGAVGYYTPQGENMRKPFLLAPLKFSRISSNFNLKRIHPLWKRMMPHRGIDYAAPTGTEVKAAGDGIVTSADKSPSMGNYIVLRHTEEYETKYLHLSRFARGIKAGKRVAQGETIGYVGSTGWATGPHLHYEFLVRGVHKNPRTVISSISKSEPITEDEHDRFHGSITPLLAELDNRKQKVQVAYLDPRAQDAP